MIKVSGLREGANQGADGEVAEGGINLGYRQGHIVSAIIKVDTLVWPCSLFLYDIYVFDGSAYHLR